jgi:heterotetrameric sarcosine oxidase gamma subunit
MILKVSASMLEHQKPFDSLPESRGSCLVVDEPGLRVTLSGAGFLLLQSTSEATLQDALTSEIGLELPAPQQCCVRGNYTLLWLTPAEWLLELPAKETDSLQSALTRRLATSLTAMTDISDAFACCQVNGARATEMLMSGCSLDLRTRAFPAGRVARAALADIPAILWKTGEPHRFRCLVDRSFAGHLRNWLVDMTRNQRAVSAQ